MAEQIKIKNKKLPLSKSATKVANIEVLQQSLPQPTTLVLKTDAKKVENGEVVGQIDVLNLKDGQAKVHFFPTDQPTDCQVEIQPKEVSKWRFSTSFPNLPENYIGDGNFEDSFFGQLTFTQVQFVLSTIDAGKYKKGLNFFGKIDYKKSLPVYWLQHLEGITGKDLEFSGVIDKTSNRIALTHDLEVKTQLNSSLAIDDLRITLFTSLEEKNEVGKDGISLEGDFLLKTPKGEKTLFLSSTISPYGSKYIGLEASAGRGEPLFLNDIIGSFGVPNKPEIIPTDVPQPGLERLIVFVDLKKKTLHHLQLRLSTGNWNKWNFFKEDSRFQIEDIYFDLSVDDLNKQKKRIVTELGGVMQIAGGRLWVYGRYPDYEFAGHLLENSFIQVSEFIEYVGVSSPESLKTLLITKLDLLANPTKKHYSFDLAIAGEWQLKDTNLKLRQLRAAFKYEKTGATAKKDFLIFGDLQINDNLVVAAGYKKEGDDWSIIGHLEYGKQVTLKQLDTSADNHVPSALTSDSFAIEYLTAAYTTKEKGLLKVSAHAVLPFTIDGKKHNLDVAILLQRKAGKDDPDSGYTGYLKSKYNYDNKLPLALNIEVKPGKKVKEKSLVFGLEEGKTTTLPALVEFLVNKEAAEVVPDLKISALQFAIDNDNLEVTIKIGESKAKDKKKSDKEKKTKTAKKITDKKPVKLSKSKEDKSDLGLSYIYFHYKRTKKAGKVTNSELQFSIEASGKFNDDVHFNLMALDYKYDFKKEEEKPATEGEKKPKKDKPQTLETKWSITGTVDVKAFGKDKLKMTSSYEKTAVVEEKKTVVKNKLKLKADSSKKDPIIDTKSFKMKSLEVILELKDTEKKKKKKKKDPPQE